MPAKKFVFSKIKQEEYLERIREGVMRGAAARELDLDPRKVREYIDTHKDFAGAVEDAEVDATEHVMEALYGAAASGSVAAIRAWLEMKGVEFAERRGRPSNPPPTAGEDPFADLNVIPIDRHRGSSA